MNILVTTPRTERENSRREAADLEAHGGHFFRTFKNLPNVQQGDRIFFVEQGEITGFGTVCDIQINRTITCDTTGRQWTGNHVCYSDWQWLTRPVPFQGFRGYRYIDNLPQDIQDRINQQLP